MSTNSVARVVANPTRLALTFRPRALVRAAIARALTPAGMPPRTRLSRWRARKRPGPPAARGGPGRSRDRLDHAARELAERGQRPHARLVVARDDVVEPEAEHRVQNQRNENVPGNRQADAAVGLQPVKLLLDHLAVAGEQLGQVSAKTLSPWRLV